MKNKTKTLAHSDSDSEQPSCWSEKGYVLPGKRRTKTLFSICDPSPPLPSLNGPGPDVTVGEIDKRDNSSFDHQSPA